MSWNLIMELETGENTKGNTRRRYDNRVIVGRPSDIRRKTDPQTSKPDLNANKEWERVKDAWNGDKEAWMRYSGYKLTEEVA